MLGILEKISPSEVVSKGYISNHNKVRHPRPKFKVSFFFLCCFWINVTQINFENIQKIQRIISDSCFQLKSRFNVNASTPSIPLLNFPFNCQQNGQQKGCWCQHQLYMYAVFGIKTTAIQMPQSTGMPSTFSLYHT